jgi:hypothetical protein
VHVFNESNTVEAYLRDLLAGPFKSGSLNSSHEPATALGPIKAPEEIYTHARMEKKREAQSKVVDVLFGRQAKEAVAS